MNASASERLNDAVQDFHACFGSPFGRRESRERSRHYLQGLLAQGPNRRNADNLSEEMGGSARSMQRFLTKARCHDDGVMGHPEDRLASRLENPEAVWLVDGSDFPEQGAKSVGVFRQYRGT